MGCSPLAQAGFGPAFVDFDNECEEPVSMECRAWVTPTDDLRDAFITRPPGGVILLHSERIPHLRC